MAYFGKEFTFDKEENYDAFVDTFGMTPERAQGFKAFKPNLKLENNADTYKLILVIPGGNKEISFKSGETVDEPVRDGLTSKTTFTVDGNTITQVQDFGQLKITYKREFTDNAFKMTVSHTSWDGEAYRWYKAV